MAGKEKTTEGTAALARPISQDTIIAANAAKKRQQVNDVKYIVRVTGQNVPSYNLPQVQKAYNPSAEAIKFAQSWDQMPQWQRDKWLSDNKPLLQTQTAVKKNSWATASPELKSAALSQAGAVLDGKSLAWGSAFIQNPDVALAAASALNNGRIDAAQMKTINTALTVIDTATKMATSVSEAKRQELWNRMSKPQQMAVIGITDELVKDWMSKAQETVDANKGTTVAETIWNVSGAKLLEGLLWMNDQAQHVYRTAALTITEGMDPIQGWEDTSTGKIRQEEYDALVTKYGRLKAEVVRDANQAMEDPDGFSSLIEKYQGNEAALQIIDEIILSDERSPEIDALLKEMSNVTRDDLGNIVANAAFQGQLKGTQLWDLVDKGTNFAAVWFGDPTLIAGKGIKTYRIMKWGMARNFGAGRLPQLLDKPEVARVFDGLTDDVLRYIDEADVNNRRIVRSEISYKFKRFGITEDAVDSLADFMKAVGYGATRNVGTATGSVTGAKFSPLYASPRAAWRGWIIEQDGLEQLLLGRPARTATALIPHASAARMERIDKALSARKFINFTGVDNAFIRKFLGDETEISVETLQKDPEIINMAYQAQVTNFIDLLLNPTTRKMIAEHYGVKLETVQLRSSGSKMGLPKKGKYSIGGFSISREAWYMRTDRWLRNLENAPSGRKIRISDASDTDQIYAWARTTFSRPMAQQFAEMWRVASVGQRRNMLAGMFHTIAQARGLTTLTPEMTAALDNVVTSSMKGAEQYAVTQASMAGVLRDIDILAQSSSRAARDLMPDLSNAAQKKVAQLNYRMSQVIIRRRELADKVKALAFDSGATAKRAKTEQDVLDELDLLRSSTLQEQRQLVDELTATENELNSLMAQMDDAVAGSDNLERLAAGEVKAGAKAAFNAINRKIRAIEKRLKKSNAEDAAVLQQQLDELVAARAKLRKENTVAYFETKKYQAQRDVIEANKADWANYNPAEINGRQHALHMYQTSDYISVPDFATLQNVSARVGVLNRVLGWSWGEGATKMTNLWSFGNLAGPRYVQRAAIEDHLGYVLQGGSLAEIAVGRQSARAIRESEGRTTGIFGEAGMKTGDVLPDWVVNNRLIGLFVKEHMNANEIRIAQELRAVGDTEALQKLVIKALSRYKITAFLTKGSGKARRLSSVQERGLELFAESSAGRSILDEVSGIGRDLNSVLPSGADAAIASTGRMRSDLKDMRRVQFGDWTQIGFNEYSANAHVLWYKMLGSVLHTDGRVGQIVFNSLRNSVTIAEARAKAIPKLVDAIKNDGALDVSRFSIFDEPGMTVDAFAARYFDDSAWYFSAANGEAVNKKLVDMLTRTSDSGAKYGALYVKDASGKVVDSSRLYIDTLRTSFTASERPAYVLGRREAVVGSDEAQIGLIDKSWHVMSDSLARVSREPIFLARYLDEYKTLQPFVQRYMDQGLDLASAERMVSDLAIRRAEEVSLAYMDNPAVRSIGAFNMRNLARYYRATEDFYRRVGRLAKYNPEFVQKLNLGYGVLDKSGFVWEDENGEQYFIYPGTGVVHQAVTAGVNAVTGDSVMVSNPFVMGGKTLMLTPSADPNSWLPTFASPVAALPIKVLTAFAPFDQLERSLLGPRGVKPTGSGKELFTELFNSVLPAHVTRALGLMNWDERNGQYASAVKNAIQVMAYNGDIDPDKVYDDNTKAEFMEKVNNISLGILGLRFILGFAAPASPELVQDVNLSDEARNLNLKSLRRGYTELLTKFNGDADKATLAWFKMNPKLMPFTVSSTESSKQAYPSLTAEAGDWMNKNSEFVNRNPEASVFLAPRVGEFSFATYALAKSQGFIQGKTAQDMFLQTITVKDYFVYLNTKDSYEQAVASARSTQERNQYDQMWANIRKEMYDANPFLAVRVNALSDKSNIEQKRFVLNSTRKAVEDIYKNRQSMVDANVDLISSMIKTYDAAMADITPLVGRTDTYSESVRRQYRDQLRQILKNIAGDDVNANNFYDTVLDRLIGG